MIMFAPAFTARLITSIVANEVVAIPVKTVDGSPALNVSAVSPATRRRGTSECDRQPPVRWLWRYNPRRAEDQGRCDCTCAESDEVTPRDTSHDGRPVSLSPNTDTHDTIAMMVM